MKRLHNCLMIAFSGFALSVATVASAQEPTKPSTKPTPATKVELIAKLKETLTGAKLTGTFTVIGKEDKSPAAEEYTIVSAQKVDEGDLWLLKARIKYGNKDTTLPVPIEIQWAGDTPIITMTDMAIPGLGDKFSTRVVIYDGLYSGTWAHGEVKGHLFGKITKEDAKEEAPKAKP
jgi:hypothetical protein